HRPRPRRRRHLGGGVAAAVVDDQQLMGHSPAARVGARPAQAWTDPRRLVIGRNHDRQLDAHFADSILPLRTAWPAAAGGAPAPDGLCNLAGAAAPGDGGTAGRHTVLWKAYASGACGGRSPRRGSSCCPLATGALTPR